MNAIRCLVFFRQHFEQNEFFLFYKMDKLKYRAVIEFLVLDGMNATQIFEKMRSVYGDISPAFSTVAKWAAEFKRGRTSLEDDPRSGRPETSITQENVMKVYDMWLDDRRLKVHDVAEALRISYGSAQQILVENLNMTKVSSRWVPRMLSFDQKQIRVRYSRECLAMMRRDRQDFLCRFVTTDETWIHHYQPESKEQSKQWVEKGDNAPRKFKTVPSAGKIMASVFWDAKGILLVDYLEKGRTINADYYCGLLDKLRTAIDEKRPRTQRKKILFHQDNAPAHKAGKTITKMDSLGFQLVPHPPYSPDLAPCDFFLFPNLKKHLAGKKFKTNAEVIAEVEAYFEELDKSKYKEGIMMLEHRWSKCIDVGGDFVEK